MESEIFKLCGVAVLCAVVAVIIGKQYGGAHETVRLAGLILALGGAASLLGTVVSELAPLIFDVNATPYVKVMLKALGISAICRICSEICRELGAAGLAVAVESAAGLAMIIVSLPVVAEVLSVAAELMEKV